MSNRLEDDLALDMTQAGHTLLDSVTPGKGFNMPDPVLPDLKLFPWLDQAL